MISTYLLLTFSCSSGITRKDLAAEYFNLGNAFYELGKYDESIEYYSKAIDLDENLNKAHYNLARVFLEKEEYQKALEIVTMLLESDSENILILQTLGYTQYQMGKAEEALKTYRFIISSSPQDTKALYNAALILVEMDEKEEALKLLLRADESDSQNEKIIRHLAILERDVGDPERAVLYFEEYSKKKPDDLKMRERLGDLYADLRFFGKALEQYNLILNKEKENSRVLFNKAVILLTAAGESEEGLETLENALKSGFEDQDAFESLLNSDTLLERTEIIRILESSGYSTDTASDETDY